MIPAPQVWLRRLRIAPVLAGIILLFAYSIWPWLPFGRASKPQTVIFYGFSILAEVMTQEVFPAFQRRLLAETGREVEFVSSFAGSGTVTNQLIMGVPADLALLSLELDAQRLAAAGVIPRFSWRKLPHHGVVNRTPFIVLVRPGNPKHIRDFQDLAKTGIEVVHPDPLTSGGANWAIVAEFGAAYRRGGSLEAGYELLLGVWRNVVAQAASARAARTQFEQGFGDALVTYEQEALWDRARGRLRAEVVLPASTIMSEHTLVVVEANVDPQERELVEAFARFLWSDEAQLLFVKHGFRSVSEELNRANPDFSTIPDPFLIADFGGWEEAKREIVDGVWKNRVLRELGR